MKIVIEIPEDKYKRIVEKYHTFPVEMKEWGLDAIKNGTPLPNGHGRLIDADAIEYDKESLETDSSQVFLVVDKDSIDLIHTIVEADKRESEVRECR